MHKQASKKLPVPILYIYNRNFIKNHHEFMICFPQSLSPSLSTHHHSKYNSNKKSQPRTNQVFGLRLFERPKN